MNRKKHIAVLHASGSDFSFRNHNELQAWSEQFTELTLIADITSLLVSVPASPSNAGFVTRVARRLIREWNKYDGFIVVLDRHSFLFTSQLLGMMLDDVGKPVVMMHPQRVAESLSVYAQRQMIDRVLRTQLLNAVQLATEDISGVLLLESLSNNQVTLAYQGVGFAIRALDGTSYGWIDFQVHFESQIPRRSMQRPQKEDIIDFSRLALALVKSNNHGVHVSISNDAGVAIVRADDALPLSVVELLPPGCTALLMAPDAAYVYANGNIIPVDHVHESAEMLAAQFAVLLWQQPQLSGQQLLNAIEESI